MRFLETNVKDCYVLELEAREDDRGFFARLFCEEEFRKHGLDPTIAQINTGLSLLAGTIRGMHYQQAPATDTKLIKCIKGEIYDVCLDIRRESPSFCEWVGVELTAENRRMLFLPAGTAHGYQNFTDNTEIIYSTNVGYSPECATGVRFDDPKFGIDWPLPVSVISEADQNWPGFER